MITLKVIVLLIIGMQIPFFKRNKMKVLIKKTKIRKGFQRESLLPVKHINYHKMVVIFRQLL